MKLVKQIWKCSTAFLPDTEKLGYTIKYFKMGFPMSCGVLSKWSILV